MCALFHYYLPEVLPADALPDTDAPAPSSPSAPPTSLSSSGTKARLAAFAAAVDSVGGIPPLVGPNDAHGCGPDAHVSALMLACLFARITEVGKQAGAAQTLQIAWLGRHSRVDSRLAFHRCADAPSSAPHTARPRHQPLQRSRARHRR